MWSYLKSDLEELVSVVKEDTSIVLEKIADDHESKKYSAALKEAEQRMTFEETFTVPLLPWTESDVGEEEAPIDSEEAEEVTAFLTSFNINDRTDLIADILEKYPDTVREHFETLVPEVVSYEQFWERYFFDATRLASNVSRRRREERARKARAELVGSVSNFLGVAAKAVASGVANALTEDDAGNPRRARGSGGGRLGGFFGSSGRPPFVMNTALDENEDDEEEELGWDDEDDEDRVVEQGYEGYGGLIVSSVDGSGVVSHLESEEQIEFKDDALDAVKEQLKLAIEERDMLHETVALQRKEIASLKGENDTSSPTGDQPFESLEDKVKRLTSVLSARELELSKTQRALDKDSNVLQQGLDSLNKENDHLRQKLNEIESRTAAHIQSLEDEIAASKVKADDLETELQTTKSGLAVSQMEVASLRTELEQTKTKLRLKDTSRKPVEETMSGDRSAESHDTSSTGVKVEKLSIVSKIDDNEDDGEEGWGDDWD